MDDRQPSEMVDMGVESLWGPVGGTSIKKRDKITSGGCNQLEATSRLWSELAIVPLGPAKDRVLLREI